MTLHRITALGRPIDFDWPTNRAIAAITLLVAIGAGAGELVLDRGFLDSALFGARAAASVFLAWALARELDPAGQGAAFGGAALGLAAAYLLPPAGLAELLLLLLALRVANRSTGLPATPLDSLVVFALAVWLALAGRWVVGLGAALALLVDAVASAPHRKHAWLAAGVLAATAWPLVTRGFLSPDRGALGGWELAALASGLLFLRAAAPGPALDVRADHGSGRLDPRRVRLAQAIGVLVLLLAAGVGGRAALGRLGPLWAAVLGGGLTGLVRRR